MFEWLDAVYFAFPWYLRIPFAVGMIVLTLVTLHLWSQQRPPKC